MSPLRRLSPEGRRALLEAVSSGRVGPPWSELSLRRTVGGTDAEAIAQELQRLGGFVRRLDGEFGHHRLLGDHSPARLGGIESVEQPDTPSST